MHGGNIGVVSSGEGSGSMFYVDIPSYKRSVRVLASAGSAFRRSFMGTVPITESALQEQENSLHSSVRKAREEEAFGEFTPAAVPPLVAVDHLLQPERHHHFGAFWWLASCFSGAHVGAGGDLLESSDEESDLETIIGDRTTRPISIVLSGRNLLGLLTPSQSGGVFLNNPVKVWRSTKTEDQRKMTDPDETLLDEECDDQQVHPPPFISHYSRAWCSQTHS